MKPWLVAFILSGVFVAAATADEFKYKVVRLDLEKASADGKIAEALQKLLNDNPTSRVISVTPLQQAGSTVAVVVIMEPTGNPTNLGLKETRLTKEEFDKLNRLDSLNPRPGPLVVKQQQVRPAIFEESRFGTQNIASVAYDARWTTYGAYLQRLIEAVQAAWQKATKPEASRAAGSYVKVVFRLDSSGAVPQIVSVEGTAGKGAEEACAKAILATAPYGSWTDDMVRVLGTSQELTFTFRYP